MNARITLLAQSIEYYGDFIEIVWIVFNRFSTNDKEMYRDKSGAALK